MKHLRRILRWSMHAVAVLCLLLGVVTMVGWPAGYVWPRTFYLTHDFLLRDKGQAQGSGRWDRWELSVTSAHGRLRVRGVWPADDAGEVTQGEWRTGSVAPAVVDIESLPWFSLSREGRTVAFVLPMPLVAFALILQSVIWVLVLTRKRRRTRRLARGQCHACGYDLSHTESDACPECGAARVASD